MASPAVECVGIGACGAVVGLIWLPAVRDAATQHRLASHLRRRSQAALRVATEAALDKAAFDPVEIDRAVDALMAVAVAIWTEGRHAESRDRSPIARWARVVMDDLGPRLSVTRTRVDILRVVSRAGELEDRIVLRVRLTLRRSKDQPRGPRDPRSMVTDERWTLARVEQGWRLLTIDATPVTEDALDASLIPGGWADEDRLREEALTELAADDAQHLARLREIVPSDGSVEEQLDAIAALDRRFDRDLLSARLTHLVDAWEESSAGSTELLEDLATPEAAHMLIHGPDAARERRLILHDARLTSWTPEHLELAAVAQIQIQIVISAVSYVVSHRTGVPAEWSSRRPHDITMDWTLTLYRGHAERWRLTAAARSA